MFRVLFNSEVVIKEQNIAPKDWKTVEVFQSNTVDPSAGKAVQIRNVFTSSPISNY